MKKKKVCESRACRVEVHANFLPPSSATRALQAAVDQGNRRNCPIFPESAIGKEWAPYWSGTPVEKAGDMVYPSVFAFLASFWRFGIASLCLLKDSGGSKLWSLGNFVTFFFVHLLEVGHKACIDPELTTLFETVPFLNPVSVIVRYERQFRAKISHLASNHIKFSLADKLSVVDSELWSTVRNHFLAFLKKAVSIPSAISGKPSGKGLGKGPKGGALGKGQPLKSAPHIPSDAPKPTPAPHSDPNPCKFIQRGQECPYGDRCKFQHVGIKRERNEGEPRSGRSGRGG